MPHRRNAFTLIEMLLVVAIIVLLISLLLPSLGGAKEGARKVQCLGQIRAVTVGWRDYAMDNNRVVVDPYDRSNGTGWIGSGNTELANTQGLLPPYFGSAAALQCPSDTSGHFRTYSMNDHLGGRWPSSFAIRHLPTNRPSETFVLLEENDPRGWNLGAWVVYLDDGGWVDYVTGFHLGGMNISFADGHAEYWQWEDERTLQINSFYATTPNNPDLERLQHAFVSTK